MKYRNTQAVLSSGKRKRVLKKAKIFSNVERTFEYPYRLKSHI